VGTHARVLDSDIEWELSFDAIVYFADDLGGVHGASGRGGCLTTSDFDQRATGPDTPSATPAASIPVLVRSTARDTNTPS
jgi:hypothetical protein